MSDTPAQDGSQSSAESKPRQEADSSPATAKQVHDPSRRRGRWYQFRLRTLLGLTLWAAVAAMAWRMYLEPYRRQQRTMDLVERLGGTYQTVRAPTWLRRLNFDDMQNVTVVDLGNWDKPESYLDAVAGLPALEMLAVGGPEFTDEHLHWLQRVKTLHGLVLDDTSVSDEALVEFKAALPRVEVYRSQRRTLELLGQSGGVVLPRDLIPSHKALQQALDPAYFAEAKELIVDGDPMMPHVARIASLEAISIMAKEYRTAPRGNLTDAGLASLGALTHLKRLRVWGADIGDAGLMHLAILTNLESLDLRGTDVTDVGLQQLDGLAKLTTLNVSHTRVTAAGLLRFKPLANLRELWIQRGKFTQDERDTLGQAMPNGRILHPLR